VAGATSRARKRTDEPARASIARAAVAVRGPKGRAHEAKKQAYQRLALAAGERVFAKRGYDGAKMQDVATETGVALATLYGAYPSKEALYDAIHRLRGRALLERAASAASGASRAWEAVLAGVEAYVDFLVEHTDYLRIHLHESQPWALDPRFVCAEQKRQWRQGLELTVSTFRQAMNDGDVREGDAELFARLMIASHQVFLVAWVEGGMKEPKATLVARIREHMTRAFRAT
jgi:AcrR family transcriptional regulator